MAYRNITIRLADGRVIIKRVDERGIVPVGGTTGQTLGKLSGTDFDVDWIDATGGSGALTADITASVTVGGVTTDTVIPAGTTFEQLFRDILSPYVPPSMFALAVVFAPNSAYFEAGQVVEIISASWSVVNDSEGNPPQSMYLDGDGFDETVTGTSRVTTGSPTTVVNDAGSVVWTLSGDDSASPANALTPITYTKYWRFRFCFGAADSANPATDIDATILAFQMQQYQLLASKVATFTATADNDTATYYTWLAYPASFGALSNIIQNGALPVLTAFTYIGAWDVTNENSVVESYRFYKSNADKAFASGTVLTIS